MNRVLPAKTVVKPRVGADDMFDPLTLVDPGLVDRMYGGAAVRCLELKLAPVEPDFGDLPWRQAGVDDLLSAYADRRVSPSDIHRIDRRHSIKRGRD